MKWVRRRTGCALLLVFAPSVAAAHGNEGERIASGILLHEHPESGAHVVLAELDSPEVSVEVVGGAGAALRPSEVAAVDPGLVVVQSGGPFSTPETLPTGLTVSGGQPWPGTEDDATRPVLAFSGTGCGSLRPAGERTTVTDWIDAALSGARELLRDGQVAAELDCAEDLCDPVARSAVGVGQSGHRLVLVVVDGPPGPGAGMTARDLATFMGAHGAYAALVLAGGSSAALAVSGALASSPSDGVERSVANVLALRSTPGGTLYKVVGVAYGDYVGGTERLANPTVELRTLSGFTIANAQSTADEGGYFETVPVLERSYHLVVGAAGRDRTCVQTIEQDAVLAECDGTPCRWSSVRLLPGDGTELGCPPIACGPPIEIEANPCGDPDGGPGTGGGGSGCGCRVTGVPPGGECVAGALVLLVALVLRRRAWGYSAHKPSTQSQAHRALLSVNEPNSFAE